MPRHGVIAALLVPGLLLPLFRSAAAENVYCHYARAENTLTCGTITCETWEPENADLEKEGFDMKLPVGWYRIGVMTNRHNRDFFPLYRRRAIGNGYWDFYTQIPERNCAGGYGLHAGENIPGSVAVKDRHCFDRIIYQLERRTTSEKTDVYQCRECLFNTCWLGWRLKPAFRDYLTNLRSQ